MHNSVCGYSNCWTTSPVTDDPMAKRALQLPQKQPDSVPCLPEKTTSSPEVVRDSMVGTYFK